jgi:uncharacterized protein YndB with AHSA1/START domain
MNSSTVNITRRYYCDPEKLWSALADGFLFVYTGAIKDKLVCEFKVHGKIHVEWKPELGGESMDGEFLEIIPLQKIVFSWNTNLVTGTKVTVLMNRQSDYCELTLTHEFPSGTDIKSYDHGWDDAMFDLKNHVYR